MAYRDQPLGELALSIPRASALFRKYDMDYCCGGKQTLARAAARKELDVEVIEAELAKLAEQPIEKDWRSAPLAEIIDHIIVRYPLPGWDACVCVSWRVATGLPP